MSDSKKTETIEVPHFEGFECVGYQYPCYGQYYLFDGELLFSEHAHDNAWLVYEKLPPKRYIFEETGERRVLRTGDLYVTDYSDMPQIWEPEEVSSGHYKILRKIDE